MYILENVPGAMQYIKARYSHIIIDEYQDCGEIQDKVFIKLVESGLTGIAVGDINQAIYGFTKRFPKYLIALMKRDDFARFELSKNHRCHPSISEYSLCLFGASKTVPREKRVFKVDISGDERNIAAAIDKYLNQIKDKYGIVRNNQVAILCRSNSTAFKVDSFEIYFRQVLMSRFLLSITQNNFFLKNWNLKNIEKHSRCAKVYFRIRSMIFAMQRIR